MKRLRQLLGNALVSLGVILGTVGVSPAQQAVLTYAVPGTTTGGNVSTTIVATNTFQLVWGAAPVSPQGTSVRRGCTIVNNGTHTMYVTEGLSIANSTTALAVPLAANQAYYCGLNGLVLSGQINITGTSGDAFYAAQY